MAVRGSLAVRNDNVRDQSWKMNPAKLWRRFTARHGTHL